MKDFILKAYPREMLKTAASKNYRKQGLTPAVMYSDGQPSTNILVDAKKFEKEVGLRYRGYGIFNLDLDGDITQVYVKKIQINHIKQSVKHIEFYKTTEGREVVVEVPLRILNADICEGVKLGGMVSRLSEYVHVKVIPSKIPSYLEIDIKELPMGQSFSVSNIIVPEDVKIEEDPHKAVVRVVGKKGLDEEVDEEVEEVEEEEQE